jgi:hypothetical protein
MPLKQKIERSPPGVGVLLFALSFNGLYIAGDERSLNGEISASALGAASGASGKVVLLTVG